MITRAEKRFYLHEQQRGSCALCGKPLELAEATLDHRFPKSRGGSSAVFNLQAAHGKCNQDKGAKVIPKFVPNGHLKELTRKQMKELVLGRLGEAVRDHPPS